MNKSGFTIIEAVIGVGLLAAMMLYLASLVSQSEKAGQGISKRLSHLSWARQNIALLSDTEFVKEEVLPHLANSAFKHCLEDGCSEGKGGRFTLEVDSSSGTRSAYEGSFRMLSVNLMELKLDFLANETFDRSLTVVLSRRDFLPTPKTRNMHASECPPDHYQVGFETKAWEAICRRAPAGEFDPSLAPETLHNPLGRLWE